MALMPVLVPSPLVAGTRVVVLDVIRAMTVVAHALAAGADGVRPVADEAQARERAAREDALLGGERGGLAPQGFDLGNSPRDYDRARCEGRPVVLTTTNGTAAVARVAGAVEILAGAFVNVEATARWLAREDGDVLIVCAGSRGELAADDVACAGCLVGNLALLAAAEPSDAARTAAALFDAWKADLPGLLRRSRSGRHLAEVGLDADLAECGAVDAVPTVARLDEHGVFRNTARA